jgi:hypothetical protein
MGVDLANASFVLRGNGSAAHPQEKFAEARSVLPLSAFATLKTASRGDLAHGFESRALC